MLFGLEIFGSDLFAKETGVPFEFWIEVCAETTSWTRINPSIIGIQRCEE